PCSKSGLGRTGWNAAAGTIPRTRKPGWNVSTRQCTPPMNEVTSGLIGTTTQIGTIAADRRAGSTGPGLLIQSAELSIGMRALVGSAAADHHRSRHYNLHDLEGEAPSGAIPNEPPKSGPRHADPQDNLKRSCYRRPRYSWRGP